MRQELKFPVRVECSVRPPGEPTPTRFSLGRVPVQVVEVSDVWFGTDHRYFKVRGDDGACYILRNDTASGGWQLILYDAVRFVH